MITSHRLILKTFNSILSPLRLTTLTTFAFSSQNDNNDKYSYPYNFNREQYRGYIKKVEKAKKEITAIENLEKVNIVPRRKRRLYDRPKHDIDQTGYAVWGLYDIEETTLKLWDHSMPVLSKVQLQPKWVIHAFGKGILPYNNTLNSHREYVFEDNDFSKFILYEYRNTTHYKKNIPNFDYENQEHLRPEMRQTKRLDPKQFWESEKFFQFRVNGTTYAQHLKFVTWLKDTIQKRKSMESYDSFIDKKFGRAFSFNQKEDMELFQPRTPFIMHVKPEHFEIKNQEKQVEKQKAPGKGKKDKKGQAASQKSAEKPTEKSAEKPQQKLIENPVQEQKSAYNFASKLDEQFRKEVKYEKKKVQQFNI